MSELENKIRELAARGEISDIGLSRNGTNTKWRASFVPCSTFGISYAEDDDPVKALILAFGAKLKSRKLPRLRDELETVEATDVTPPTDLADYDPTA